MSDTTEPEMLARFMDGMKQAAGSAHQLAHAQRNPMWLRIRDLLEAARANGIKIATSRPVPQQEVMKMIDAHKVLGR